MSKERKSIISTRWDSSEHFLYFAVAGVGEVHLDVGMVAGPAWLDMSELGQSGLLHGLEQKVRDSAAIPRDTKTGASASPQEKFDAMQATIEQLHQGIWNVKGAKTQALNRQALFAAVAEVRQRSVEEVEQRFRDRQDEVLRAFLTHREIAAAYARLTARDSGQADSLLAELE